MKTINSIVGLVLTLVLLGSTTAGAQTAGQWIAKGRAALAEARSITMELVRSHPGLGQKYKELMKEAGYAYLKAIALDPKTQIPDDRDFDFWAPFEEHKVECDAAISAAEKAIKTDPRNPDIRVTLGWLYCRYKVIYGRDRRREGVQQFAAALASKPTHKTALTFLAKWGPKQIVREAMEKAIEMEPNNPQAYRILISSLADDEPAKAAELSEKLALLGSSSPMDFLQLGRSYIKAGALDKAMNALKHALTLTPGRDRDWTPSIIFSMAEVYLAKGELENAYDAVMKASALGPKVFDSDFELAAKLGEAYLKKGDIPKAAQFLPYRWLEIIRTNVAVDQNEAALKLRGKGTGTNDWAMARSAYLLAAKLLPKHPVLLLNLAIADFDLGLYSECAGAYETLAVIAPNKLEANDCARLGSSYAVLGEYSKAVSSFEKGLRASPGDENLHGWFAVASYGSGGWPAAKEAWRRNHPEPALRDRRVDREQFFDWVYGGLWDLAERAERKNIRYAALKHYSMAHAVLSEAVRDDLFYGYGDWPLKERRKIVSKVAEIYQQLPLKPVLPPAAERLALEGQNYISQREWAKARASYQMALDLAPWWPEGHYNLALLWGAEPGFEPGAIREMRIYLNLAPNGNRAQTATAKLRVWEQRMRDAISQGAQVRDDLPFLIKPDREP